MRRMRAAISAELNLWADEILLHEMPKRVLPIEGHAGALFGVRRRVFQHIRSRPANHEGPAGLLLASLPTGAERKGCRTPAHSQRPGAPGTRRRTRSGIVNVPPLVYTGAMRDPRPSASARALRELRIVRDERNAELALLDRAIERLEQADRDRDTRCDVWHHDSPCEGAIHARWCRHCGETTRRCESHGGIRAATHAADLHRSEHDGSDARDQAPDRPEGVPGRAEERRKPMPVGVMPVPPAPRGRDEQAPRQLQRDQRPPSPPSPRRPTYHPPAQQPRPQANGATAGIGVLRRRGNRSGMDG